MIRYKKHRQMFDGGGRSENQNKKLKKAKGEELLLPEFRSSFSRYEEAKIQDFREILQCCSFKFALLYMCFRLR